MSNSAFVAHSARFIGTDHAVERIKLATLLFDEIHWTTTKPTIFAEARSPDSITKKTMKELASCWIGQTPDIPQYGLYNIDDTLDGVLEEERYPELFAAAKRAFSGSDLSEDGDYEDYKLAIYTMTEILYWRKYHPERTFIGGQLSDLTLHAYAIQKGDKAPVMEALSSPPSLFDLDWNDIALLRRSPYLRQFRSKYSELVDMGNTEKILDIYLRTLESLSDEVKPSPVKSSIIGVLSNLPSPIIVNPIGIADSINNVYKEKKRAEKFGWAFFVREARALSEK